MRPIETTELPALIFNKGQERQAYHSQSNKIGWLRVFTEPNATFNLRIKDGLGRVKAERLGIRSNPDGQFGELINLDTMLGENLEVEVENLQ